MGYPVDLFLQGQHLDEFKCSICHEVMKDPTMTEGCEHVFCIPCIETWMTASNTCPACRDKITGLRAPCRPYLNLYFGLKLRCCFEGCTQVFDLGLIEEHTKSCEWNPDGIKLCTGNCGGYIKMKEIPTHDCFEYLQSQLEDRDLKINQLEKQLKLKTTNANTYLDWLGQKDNEIDGIKAGYIKIIRSKDKECTDLWRRKNDEIENIKKGHVDVIGSKDKLIGDLQTKIVLMIVAFIIIFIICMILFLNSYKYKY